MGSVDIRVTGAVFGFGIGGVSMAVGPFVGVRVAVAGRGTAVVGPGGIQLGRGLDLEPGLRWALGPGCGLEPRFWWLVVGRGLGCWLVVWGLGLGLELRLGILLLELWAGVGGEPSLFCAVGAGLHQVS